MNNKTFITDSFLLQSNTAHSLYFNYAQHLPIIDFHNHLDPQQIAQNTVFETITQVWLKGDHYKWRAMRANGIAENLITGQHSSDQEKFLAWAKTVPKTVRNPLYHWTHLELLRYFGIDVLLNENTAQEIYETCNAQLQKPDFSTQGLLKKMKVEVVGTTDDPIDSLEFHKNLPDSVGLKMVPTFRPDKVLAIENQEVFQSYLQKLGQSAAVKIESIDDLKQTLLHRYEHFVNHGGKATDHGLEQIEVENYTENEIGKIFKKSLNGQILNELEVKQYKSAMMEWLAIQNHSFGLVQQFHLGAMRNNNLAFFEKMGADTGHDTIGEYHLAKSTSRFLDKLNYQNKLAKTILYNLNPSQNDVFAALIGNFQDESYPGKIQFGPAWWFLDQKSGIENHLNSLSNMGLVSRFVGMITDSRSLLSFTRHEYFRRILCNVFAQDINQGLLPNDLPFIGKIIEDIGYFNAKNYFNFK